MPPCTKGNGLGWEVMGSENYNYHIEGIEQPSSVIENWDIQIFPPQILPTFIEYESYYPKEENGCEMGSSAVYEMAGVPLYILHLNDPVNFVNACDANLLNYRGTDTLAVLAKYEALQIKPEKYIDYQNKKATFARCSQWAKSKGIDSIIRMFAKTAADEWTNQHLFEE